MILRLAALVAVAFSAATAVDYYGAVPRFCQPGAGCDTVHAWSSSLHIDMVLPAFGLTFYTLLLVFSLVDGARVQRWVAIAASLGGVGALGFVVVQKLVIGAWCWLCLGVDSAAVVAGIAGADHLRRNGLPQLPPPSGRSRGAWAIGWALAIGLPPLWSLQTEPARAPPSIVELQRPGAINITVLSDPECPYCRLLHVALEQAVAANQDVVLTYVLVPLAMHPLARDASKAVLCAEAAKQDTAMRTFVYTTEDLSRPALIAEATRLGLQAAEFDTCLSAPQTEARIVANIALAKKAQMQGLPTVYVNDQALIGFDARRGAEPYRRAIERARKRK